MSPAQLHRHPAKEGYVGTAVDVWAAGVLLSVMLLGALYPVRCNPVRCNPVSCNPVR
jgi:serine/threonine protein kinase